MLERSRERGREWSQGGRVASTSPPPYPPQGPRTETIKTYARTPLSDCCVTTGTSLPAVLSSYTAPLCSLLSVQGLGERAGWELLLWCHSYLLLGLQTGPHKLCLQFNRVSVSFLQALNTGSAENSPVFSPQTYTGLSPHKELRQGQRMSGDLENSTWFSNSRLCYS